MDSKGYLALNARLQKADGNYLSGRCLWLNLLIEGGCNLLRLSIEQLLKILILQKNIDNLLVNKISSEEIHKTIDTECKTIGHNLDDLLEQFEFQYPNFNIAKYKGILEKLQEYFFRRYVVPQGSSIPSSMINDIDELYFGLRNFIDPDIGLGLIDEIYIQKKNLRGHPLASFEYAYKDNNFFKPRKHRKIVYSKFDGTGEVWEEDGSS